jgi:hypothetical protein
MTLGGIRSNPVITVNRAKTDAKMQGEESEEHHEGD